ncbi:transcriptional regulator [Mycobacterium tuberculosis]|nr:transcriptional regulator [Mycobacterium tuberculosis]
MSSEEKLAAKVSTKASDVASDIGSFIRSQRERRTSRCGSSPSGPASAIRT